MSFFKVCVVFFDLLCTRSRVHYVGGTYRSKNTTTHVLIPRPNDSDSHYSPAAGGCGHCTATYRYLPTGTETHPLNVL
jgi:hypothetical protein